MIRLRDLLKETRGVPFPVIAPDMNRDGQVTDADLKAQARRRKAVINALRERMISEQDNFQQDIPRPGEDQSDMEKDGTSAKAELLSIHKKAGELYNMVGDGEQLEGWIHEKISKAAEFINAIHSTLEYQKSKPTSVGDGAGSPADLTTQALAEDMHNETDGATPQSGEDHEVSMAQNLINDIIKNANEIKGRLGNQERDIPAWIQDHISQAQNFISQANTNFHESESSDEPTTMNEVAPKGWEKTVLKMKKKKNIDNPWALAHWMKNKGYHPRAGKKGKE
tara:strand:- start:235 stop:1077 length:843 start_codon:yes stop_codon:yes gene_type:complete